ncbi:MAG: hypothetical protein O2890_10155, partial [Cyanobacteria bacterium]|nr:hypothetical protein [Cyanobacteriota bacterium]
LESEVVRPIWRIQQKIQALRSRNARIVFISDMYLPTELIQKALMAHGLAQPGDPVYVSGDIGLTKASGNLFRYVLGKEGLQPQQLHHTGDNIYSDVQVPKQLGIQVTHVTDPVLNRYERHTLLTSTENWGVRSQIAGISRATRLTAPTVDVAAPALTALMASVVAPFLTSYVAWVLQDAQRRGLQRLYFVARDGQILLKIAETLCQSMAAPECRYLYGSRQAWFLPSVTQINPQALDWLILPGQSTAPRHLLQRLGLTPETIADQLCHHQLPPHHWDQQLDDQEIAHFWQVLQSPAVSPLILQTAAIARQRTQRYLHQEGLLSDHPWAIVDAGWTLKCQRSLRTLLQNANPDTDVQGYYLGVLRERLPIAEAGEYRAWLMQDTVNRQPLTINIVFQRMKIIEQIFMMADHGTTLGYTQQGDQMVPVCKNEPMPAVKAAYVAHLQDTVQRYAQEIAQTDVLHQHLPVLRQCVIANMVSLLGHPQCQEVRAISGLNVGDDQNESRAQPIARPVQIQDIVYFAKRLSGLAQARDYTAGFTWLEGGVRLSNPVVQLAYRMALALQAVIRHQEPISLYQGMHKIRFSLHNRRVG